jgi:hypothetical protein
MRLARLLMKRVGVMGSRFTEHADYTSQRFVGAGAHVERLYYCERPHRRGAPH